MRASCTQVAFLKHTEQGYLSGPGFGCTSPVRANSRNSHTHRRRLQRPHKHTDPAIKQLTRTYSAHSTSQAYHTQSTLALVPDGHRGQLIAGVICNSNHITLNTNSPTIVPNTTLHKHIHQISPRCLTDDITTDYNILSPTTRKPTGHNSDQHTHCQHIFFTNIILMADKRNIPKGKMHCNCSIFPDHIVCKITQRNTIRRANTCDPAFKRLNEEITYKNINKTYRRYI